MKHTQKCVWHTLDHQEWQTDVPRIAPALIGYSYFNDFVLPLPQNKFDNDNTGTNAPWTAEALVYNGLIWKMLFSLLQVYWDAPFL